MIISVKTEEMDWAK